MNIQNFDVLMSYALWAIKIAVCLALGEHIIELSQRRDGAASIRFIKFCIGAIIALNFDTVMNLAFPGLALKSVSGSVSTEADGVLKTAKMFLRIFQAVGVGVCAIYAAHSAWKAIHGDRVRWVETFFACALTAVLIMNISPIAHWFTPNSWGTLDGKGITN